MQVVYVQVFECGWVVLFQCVEFGVNVCFVVQVMIELWCFYCVCWQFCYVDEFDDVVRCCIGEYVFEMWMCIVFFGYCEWCFDLYVVCVSCECCVYCIVIVDFVGYDQWDCVVGDVE